MAQEDLPMSETRQLTLTDKKKLEAELAELIEAKKKVAEDIQTAVASAI